jgi:hypothetical protein
MPTLQLCTLDWVKEIIEPAVYSTDSNAVFFFSSPPPSPTEEDLLFPNSTFLLATDRFLSSFTSPPSNYLLLSKCNSAPISRAKTPFLCGKVGKCFPSIHIPDDDSKFVSSPGMAPAFTETVYLQ